MTNPFDTFIYTEYSGGGKLNHDDVGGVRFLDKSLNANERNLYNKWWQEQIFQYGTEVDYWSSQFNLHDHDHIYGEDPTRAYGDPKKLVMALELNESAIILNKFGLAGDDEIAGYIAIDTFYTVFGSEVDINPKPEPKSGDIFRLTEYGSHDHIGGRGGKMFEITERLEQDVSKINPLIGHYIWLIKAKRYEYSFEPGVPQEPVSEQINDDTGHGILPGGDQPPSSEKLVDYSADRLAEDIFYYDDYGESNDDVYGGYV